jgi:hypothetical protein
MLLHGTSRAARSPQISAILSGRYRSLYLGQPGDRRVLRGGSWINNQDNTRAAYRNNNNPDKRNNNIGFRVVLVRRPTSHCDSFFRVSGLSGLMTGCWTGNQAVFHPEKAASS